MDDVRAFFKKHYAPQNAILVVAGAVTVTEARRLAEKWFGPIPGGPRYERQLPVEPRQTEPRFLEVAADVPLSALYKVYHMPARTAPDYYSVDLLGDLLGRGKSSRLYQQLVKEQPLFNSISATATGSMEPGLLVISGKLNAGVTLEAADAAVEALVANLRDQLVPAAELEKVKNQAEASLVFGEIELLHRAMNLAYSKLMGNTNLVNEESARLQAVTPADVQAAAREVLRPDNCSTLYYRAQANAVLPELAEAAGTAVEEG
jgi:predicted Zn-dependent peptidase